MRGEDYYRLMTDQSRRAHDFDRRMRWFWLRRTLTDRTAEELTTSAVPAVPRQRG